MVLRTEAGIQMIRGFIQDRICSRRIFKALNEMVATRLHIVYGRMDQIIDVIIVVVYSRLVENPPCVAIPGDSEVGQDSTFKGGRQSIQFLTPQFLKKHQK